MKVLMSCVPGLGNLYPLLPLATALSRGGHDVVCASADDLQPAVQKAGLRFYGAGPDLMTCVGEALHRRPDTLLDTPADQQRFAFASLFTEVRVDLALDELLRVADEIRPDLLIGDSGDFVAPLVAAETGVPHATVGIGLPHATELMHVAAVAVAPAWSRRGLDPPPDGGLYRGVYLDQWPIEMESGRSHASGRVEALQPVPFGSDERVSDEIRSLGTRRPLVYVTFGTIFSASTTIRSVLEALDGVDVDVLVTTGALDPKALGPMTAPNVMIRSFVPQAAVLERCRLMVTHGGAGSVLGALSSGVPMLVLPEGADQEDNANQVQIAGCGLALGANDRSVDSVRACITGLLGDGAARQSAGRVREAIAAMPTPADVAQLLERMVLDGD